MSLDDRITRALTQRAQDVAPRQSARAAFGRRVTKGYERRLASSGVLALGVVVLLSLSTARLIGNQDEQLLFHEGGPSTYRTEMRSTVGGEVVSRATTLIDAATGLVHMRAEILNAPEPIVLEAVTSKEDIFIRMKEPRDGKAWARVPDLPAPVGMLFMLGQNPALQEMTNFADLRAFAKEVTKLERVTIRGLETIEYEVQLDQEALFELLPEEFRPSRQEWENLQSGLPPQHVFVGVDDGLIHRTTVALAADAEGNNEGKRVEMITDYLDYGKPVDIRVPHAGEVYEPNKDEFLKIYSEIFFPGFGEDFGPPSDYQESPRESYSPGRIEATFSCSGSSIEGSDPQPCFPSRAEPEPEGS